MFMETGENKPKHKWKNVHVDTNLTTGKRYFEKRKVEITDPTEPPPEPGIRYSRTESGALIVPPEVPLSLHKPKDVGTPRWQEQQEKNG